MQQRLMEFQQILQEKNPQLILNYIKELMNKETAETLKKILTIARHSNIGFSENIIEFAIRIHAHELFAFLRENSWLVPPHFFVKNSRQDSLLAYAVTHKNSYFIKSHKSELQDKAVLANLLYLAAKQFDYSTLKFLLYYGTPLISIPNDLSINDLSIKFTLAYLTAICTQKEKVKKLHNNLFSFFTASHFDSGSSIYGLPIDCVKMIQDVVLEII